MTTISINDIERLRNLNKAARVHAREHKAKPTITVTGTFAIAKAWDAQQVKKVALPNGIEVNDAVVEDIGVKWLTVQWQNTTHYLKLTEEATGTITLK